MRTLEKKEKGFNWECFGEFIPVITVLFIFALFLIGLGILQICSGNY